MAEFEMARELASHVKDDQQCRNLILSKEEAFVKFLQNDSSSDRVLELEPMDPYQCLLVNRLADIFRFSHKYVGEGEAQHLILERSSETSIPSILVSDLISLIDEETQQPPASFQLLKRDESKSGETERHVALAVNESSIEERERAYSAARERIFSDSKESQTSPVSTTSNNAQRPKISQAAHRMISRALGKDEPVSTQNENKKTLREEHEGAARRLLANAFGDILTKSKQQTNSDADDELGSSDSRDPPTHK